MAYNIFERWPFTSFQNLNLDWILKITKKAGEDSTEALTKAQTALDTTAGFSDRVDQIGQQASAAETTAGTAIQRADSALSAAASAESTANTAASQVDAAFSMASDAQQAAEAAQTSASTAYSAAVTAGQNAQTGITNAAAAQTAANSAQTTANTALSNANEALYRLANAVGVYEYTLTGAAVYDKGGLPASSAEMIDDMSDGVMPILKDSSTGEVYLPVDVDGQQIKFFSPQLMGGSVAIQYGYLVTVGTNGSATKTRYAIGPSSGSGVFLITAIYNSTNQNYSFNKSAAEITAAIGNNMLPVVQIYSELGSQYDRLWFVFTHSSYDGEDTYFNFVCSHGVGLIRYMQFVVSESRAVIYDRSAVPAATSQDEGKILTVNSFGNYRLVMPAGGSFVEVVNVKDYGAAGNGLTDDTTAFANAVTAVPSGGALYVPAGVYVVQNVDLKSHMSIFGDGFSSEIRLADALDGTINGNCLTINGSSSSPITDVHIHDLKLSGSRSTQTSTGNSADQRLNGIHIRYAENVSISHVWMTNNGYHGIIATYTKRASVTDCLSTENGFRPIHFHDGCEDILISGNTCLNNGLGVSGGSGNLNDGILVFGITRCVISGNTVKCNENGGIIASHASTGVTISNNIVECYSLIANTQTSAGSCCIYLEGGLSDFAVNGNVLRHAYRGIYLYGSSTDGRVLNGTITGNSISDCHIGINFNLLAEGIACNNNSFYNCINKAVELNRCKHVSFSGNEILVDSTIQDTTLAPAAVSFFQAVECVVAANVMNLDSHYRYGVRVYGTDTTYTGTGNEVKNNTINGAQTSGTQIEVSGNLASMNAINGVLTDMPA